MKTRIHFLILVVSICLSLCTSAQNGWEPKGPLSFGENIKVNCFMSKGTDLYVGTSANYGWVYLSKDNGDTWTQVSNGLTSNFSPNVQALLTKDTFIFAGTDDKYNFRASSFNPDWAGYLTGGATYALATYGNTILAGSFPGVKISLDNGETWNPSDPLSFPDYLVICFGIKDSYIFAGTTKGVYKSEDMGFTWIPSNIGIPSETDVNAIGVNGSNIFAGTDKGIFLSSNNGSSWTQKNNGLQTEDTDFTSFAFYGSSIFVSSSGVHPSLYQSTNNGATWSEITSGLPMETDITELQIHGDYLFAGTRDAGVYRRALSELTSSEPYIQEKESISLYPNPTHGHITVALKALESNDVEMIVSNLLGQEVYSKDFQSTNGEILTELDLANIQKGLYTIKIIDGSKSVTQKFIFD